MAATITALETYDVRFPTSDLLDGSDAMNPDPDYSAAYVILRTDAPDGLEGHGFAFTIGRGTEVQVAAIDALRPLVVGLDLDEVLADPAAFWRRLTGDSQLRWLGPEKGVMHMATAAVVNAVWDLYAKREGVPLWQLLARMSPEQIVGAGRLPLPHRRADARRGAGAAARARAGPRRARARAAGRRAPGLHDVAGLARLRRRQAALG